MNELSVSSHGIVLRNDVIVIPSSLQQKVIDYAHEGHNGLKLCKCLLRNICWFPKMDQMVEKTIKDCVPCQCTVRSTTTEPIMPTMIPKSAWHTIEIDFSRTLISTQNIEYSTLVIQFCMHGIDLTSTCHFSTQIPIESLR